MNKHIIKFKDGQYYKWVIVPERNTINDIEGIYNTLSIEDFKEFLKEFIVDDNDGEPNIIQATNIVKTNKDITEIDWQLYSLE